ncbi:flavin-linked sulfhydryl oxidase KNAG_0B02070 [Huiozyma naganishii CBS 8797]|uniref:Sulfhydryl oxidase n=1 Tax=Huiozyma naganishii (strain ATCC MYA-139 / BCRC 22969 / CBS 8797 / KCTC 17520 / NBRC 10181 / NCYC 3082 / Yp74L-3) TaxID=1071383 RepID=J7S3C9_HUIN7|nr:hypothetical protein KNAG_0B02070 [Kazachstania naganishii CBS 8797]CCK68649.1 hypothetical protein KNAG_0B02070 [Kazachstania naganishii CBS 8797]
MAPRILSRFNVVRLVSILSLLCLWLFFSSIEISFATSISHMKDPNVIIDSDIRFSEDYKMVSVYSDKRSSQLGQSAWLLFHSYLNGTEDHLNEKECHRVKRFVRIFAEEYPLCRGDVNVFNELVQSDPIPTSCGNRFLLKLWGCHVHNRMNVELGKQEYDCSLLFTDDELSDNSVKFNKVSISNEGEQPG